MGCPKYYFGIENKLNGTYFKLIGTYFKTETKLDGT